MVYLCLGEFKGEINVILMFGFLVILFLLLELILMINKIFF